MTERMLQHLKSYKCHIKHNILLPFNKMSLKSHQNLSETKLIFQQNVVNRFNGSDGKFTSYPMSISFVSNKYCFIVVRSANDGQYSFISATTS